MSVLSLRALNRATLARQLLLKRHTLDARTAIERIAGMQAQVPKPPFLGLWSRLANFDREELRQSIASKQVVRGTLMRGTLHLVSRKDFLAWRPVLQPMLAAIERSLTKKAGPLDIDTLSVEGRRFFDEHPRTFEELRTHLASTFPRYDKRSMAYAVRMHLPLVMVPDDSAWSFPADSAFAVAETFLGAKLKRGEGAHDLVQRYLEAFGPATPADFQAWSGLGGAKAVFEELDLERFRDERKRELFDVAGAPHPDESTPAPVRFLPEFDNLLLAHADRTRIIADEHRPRVVTKNLRILPVFLVEGFVAGTWSMVKKKVTLQPFGTLTKKVREALEEESERLAEFAA